MLNIQISIRTTKRDHISTDKPLNFKKTQDSLRFSRKKQLNKHNVSHTYIVNYVKRSNLKIIGTFLSIFFQITQRSKDHTRDSYSKLTWEATNSIQYSHHNDLFYIFTRSLNAWEILFPKEANRDRPYKSLFGFGLIKTSPVSLI